MNSHVNCPILENNGFNIDWELLFMAKEKHEPETEEPTTIRK